MKKKFFKNSTAVRYKAQGWNRNTDLGCDVKTVLRNDARMKTGKAYLGVLTLDSDADVDEFLCRDTHFTFVETLPSTDGKRNPRVYDGKYITVTRRDDGTYRPNFKPLKADRFFSVDAYALAVCNELSLALGGLL